MDMQRKKGITAIAACLALGLGLTACVSNDTQTGNSLVAGAPGGTGGTGVGEITGFGSIHFNDDSVFATDDDTEFWIDGVRFDNEAAFKAAFGGSDDAVGAVSIVEVRDDISDDFTSGTAARIDVRSAIKGPVTGTEPLQVLGQAVMVTGSTVLANLPGGIGSLGIGDHVEVSGFTQHDNLVSATRIQRKQPGDLDEWKLTGFVTASGSGQFHVGTQVVSLAVVAVNDCGGPVPPVGSFVEVKANPLDHAAFTGGALTASKAECKPRGIIGELDDSGVRLQRIQGFISAFDGDIQGTGGTLTIGGTGSEGQTVQLTSGTSFRGGTREDLVIGVKVEVRGQFDGATGVLTAARVSFRETRVRIEATLEAGQVNPAAGTISLLGITVHRTLSIRDDDNLFAGNQPARDVRIRGFVDRDGTVHATRIDDRDDAGGKDLRLRGPVDADSIFADSRTFSILDIEIRPGSQTRYRDHVGRNSSSNTSISETEFFARLTSGHPVQVHGGSYIGPSAGGPAIVNPSEIELED